MQDRVERFVRGRIAEASAYDVVVLDPPRTGAGAAVVQALVRQRRVRSPTSRATRRRWPATWRSSPRLGYGLGRVRAFDIFPMTHHVECVAILPARPA